MNARDKRTFVAIPLLLVIHQMRCSVCIWLSTCSAIKQRPSQAAASALTTCFGLVADGERFGRALVTLLGRDGMNNSKGLSAVQQNEP